MNLFCKKAGCLSAILLCMLSARGQVIFAEDATGKANYSREGIFNRVYTTKGLTRAKAASLNQSLAKQLDAFYKLPLLNPPVGFSTRTSFSVEAPGAFNTLPIPAATFHFSLYYLIKDRQTGQAKISLDGTEMVFETNTLNDFCDKIGNFWQDCYKLKLPLFFEQVPVVDSTTDYIDLNFKYYGYPYILNNSKDTPIRIMKCNNKPLFIPLTRKEFLQYLIARDDNRIKENRDAISDDKKQIASTKKNIADPAYQSIKSTLEKTLTITEAQIAKTNDVITSLQQRIAHFRNVMDAMSQPETTAPARLDENKRSEELFGLEQLVPYGRQEGTMLCKVNPDYFDKLPDAPAAQLIIVYYNISSISSFITDLNYLQQKTVAIFNQINYHQLKESMK